MASSVPVKKTYPLWKEKQRGVAVLDGRRGRVCCRTQRSAWILKLRRVNFKIIDYGLERVLKLRLTRYSCVQTYFLSHSGRLSQGG